MKWIYIATLFLIVSCGSSERVITNDGSVYKVKGDRFYNKGEEVTEQLSDIEKKRISSILEKRLEAEKLAENKQDEIAKALKDLRDKEQELKEKQRQLEDKINRRQEAREDFFEVKKELTSVKNDYQELKDKGELSPKEEAKWKKRLKKLEKEVKEAELKVNN